MQFKAGYIVDSIAKVITDFKSSMDKHKPNEHLQLDQITGLLQHVSSFDVEFPEGYNPVFTKLNPVLATLNNIITRGLPTRAPILLENLFSDINLTQPNIDEFEYKFPCTINPISYEGVFELLHIIEPQLQISKSNYGGYLGSCLEWDFIKKHPFLKQILQSQRDFSTINARLKGNRTVDFCFTYPYLNWNEENNRYEKIGRIFEVDGPHHTLSEYKYYDNYRDALADNENFETIRFTDEVIKEDKTEFESLIGENIYQKFKNNFEKNIEKNLSEYSLIFIPLAVARVQKTILEFLLVHPELFKKEKIDIAIVERDLPCGAIAIKSLQELFFNINAILDDKDKLFLPEISLTIFENSKWVIDNKLHLHANVKDESFFKQNKFDIILDHSILRRSNIYKETDFQNDKSIKIRSSHFFDTAFGKGRRVYCADLLHYKALVKKKVDGSYLAVKKYESHINFFIQTIFRKVSFREGQLPIISRALQQKPVIGLLPTGGGKSLTFQLPTFLQPGLCLVVDPIKSLMEDQVRVLQLNWIDCCDFINSNLKREEKTKKLVDFRYGETMFLFVSPERFVMQDFRNIISRIGNSTLGLAFAYCVIDEVHCVSEWGHDFRTTYLMLGKNAQEFATTKNGKDISLIGLTATASFDVLTDIERELSINSDEVNDAVISIDNTIRPELFFSVVENETKATTFPVLSQTLKDMIGFAKQSQINMHIEGIIDKLNSINDEVVTECLNQHYNDFELNMNFNDEKQINHIEKIKNRILEQTEIEVFDDVESVIFCPHTTGTFGITQDASPFPRNKEIFENLVVAIENKGYFMGGDDKIKKGVIENAQKYFFQFMQGKINYMVCTKAFGMGIDKEHIRSIYHLNLSSSPESYIQEAGRAGRDKVKSVCSIFLDRNFYYTISHNFITENNPQNFQLISHRKEARELFEDYNSFQNRISEKYYGDIASLTQNFKNIGVELDEKYIQRFNQDLSIHEYFHSNSFKGVKTELYQLNRFINYREGINTTQLKISQEKYNIEFVDDINLNLTLIGNFQGNMLINNSRGYAIGKIFSANTNPTVTIHGLPARQEPDLIKSQQILDFLVEEWNNNGRIEPLLFNFLENKIIEGFNNGLSLIEYFESAQTNSFWFKVPSSFNRNNLEARLVLDFNLTDLPIFNRDNKTVDFIKTLKDYSSNFDDFILRIEEQWDINITSSPIYIQNINEYKVMYYSEIDGADVSKIIYRLYSIGLIEDYTFDYNLGVFSFKVFKSDKKYYIEKTQSYLLKYMSMTVTLKKIQELRNITLELSVFDTIKKCVKEILRFTYEDIVKKRKDAVNDLFNFISESLTLSKQKDNNLSFHDFWYNYHFKDEMYYYFNAKYARVGFKIGNESYSLLDDTEKGQISNWGTFEKYAKVLNDQSSFISECKMMRGSCRRIWRTLYKDDNDREYVLKLLSSFATFGLNNKFYYQEAEDLFIEGFSIYYYQTQNYNELKARIENFEMHLLNCTSNENYLPYLNMAKHRIMVSVNLKFAKNINQQLQNLL
jgi:ATP-dependent DNA helicase RecQ